MSIFTQVVVQLLLHKWTPRRLHMAKPSNQLGAAHLRSLEKVLFVGHHAFRKIVSARHPPHVKDQELAMSTGSLW